MDKAHEVTNVTLSGKFLKLKVDGKKFKIDLAEQSPRLAKATQVERNHFEVSPTGYGIHWPDIDEDLSIDGLIGLKKKAKPGARTYR